MTAHTNLADRVAQLPTIEEVLADPATSHWLKSSLKAAIERDPVNAANDADVLACLISDRYAEMLECAALEVKTQHEMDEDDVIDLHMQSSWLRTLRALPREILVENVAHLTSENSALQLRSLSMMQQLQHLASELGMNYDEVQTAAGETSAKVLNLLVTLLPLAIATLRQHQLVDQALARHTPAAAAALLAERRYHARHSTSSWPSSVKARHTKNFLVSAMEEGGVRPPASSDLPMWASAMEHHSFDSFDVGSCRNATVDDGREAERLGSIAGYGDHRHCDEQTNPYPEGTFKHVIWKNAERRARMRWDYDQRHAAMRVRQAAWLAKPPMLVTLEIVHNEAPDEQASNLPSHLFPGCSNGLVLFRVTEGTPDQEQIAAVVNGIEEDAYFSSYMPASRTGSYAIVDGASSLKVGASFTRWTRQPDEDQSNATPSLPSEGANPELIPARQLNGPGFFKRLGFRFNILRK